MCQLAWRSGCSEADRESMSSGGPAADVPPSEPKVSDWRGGRAAASTSLHPAFSGPAAGLAGDRGGDLAGAAPSGAQRSDLQAGQFAKRASFTRSVKEKGPAIPGHGKGPPRVSAGSAGLTVLRQGWKPVKGRDAGTPVARRAARQPGPAQRGDAQAHRDLAAMAPGRPPPHPAAPAARSTHTWETMVPAPRHRTSETTRPSTKRSHRRLWPPAGEARAAYACTASTNSNMHPFTGGEHWAPNRVSGSQ